MLGHLINRLAGETGAGASLLNRLPVYPTKPPAAAQASIRRNS